jgi:hypothetical protein
VGHRIQAEAAHQSRGVVAEPVGGVRVHEFVDGDPKDDRDDEADERHRIIRGPLDRRDQAAGEPRVRQQEQADDEERVHGSGAGAASASDDHL